MFLRDEFQKDTDGLPSLVLYSSLVAPGVVELYDGALTVSWRYQPRSLDHESFEDREHLDEQIAKALNLGSSWCVESNMIRRETTNYYESQNQAPVVGQLIDEERRLQFTTPGYYFASEYFLSLTYLPPSLEEQRLENWVTGSNGEINNARERNRQAFEQKVISFEAAFGTQLALERLTVSLHEGFQREEHLSYLRECVLGESLSLALPRLPLYLNERFTGNLLGGNSPVLEEKQIRVLSVDAFPDGSWPSVFARLERLPFPYRYHQRQILFHPEVSKKKHKENEKAWKRAGRSYSSKLFSPNGAIDPDAAQMQEDAKHAQALASRAEYHFGAFNAKVILIQEDLNVLAEQIKQVRDVFHSAGYAVRLETDNALDAWRGSWPGHAYADCRVFPVHTKNFAHTLPKSVPFTGRKTTNNPLLPKDTPPLFRAVTEGGTPYDGQLHFKEAGHTLCTGPTRNGKSTALAFLAAQWMTRMPNPQVFAFDKRGSMRILCEAMGGTYYLLQNPQLCPLSHLEDSDDLAWATSYMEYLCHLNNLRLKPKHRQCIGMAVRMVASWPVGQRSLTNFCAALIGGEENEEIRQALEYYTVDSTSGGSLIDANEDSLRLENTRFAVFEMEHLLGQTDRRVLHAVMPYLLRLIRKRMHSAKQTLIPIDEAWMTKDPAFSEALRLWLTEAASRGGAVLLSTQNLSDFIHPDNPLRDVVMNQCKNRIYLPNPAAASEEQSTQYLSLGLNTAQILAISKGTDKRDYFFQTPDGFSKIDLQLKKVALAFCGASSDIDHERWQQHYQRDPKLAPAEWLKQRGEWEWAEEYRQLLNKEQEEWYACA